MGKNKICKIVGRIDKSITDRYNISKYENQEIVQSLDFYSHVYKHISEFESFDAYNEVVINIEKILANPYFVYYEKSKNSLRYFYEMSENICVVVKLKLKDNDDNYVATVYPVSKNKVIKLKEKSYIIGAC